MEPSRFAVTSASDFITYGCETVGAWGGGGGGGGGLSWPLSLSLSLTHTLTYSLSLSLFRDGTISPRGLVSLGLHHLCVKVMGLTLILYICIYIHIYMFRVYIHRVNPSLFCGGAVSPRRLVSLGFYHLWVHPGVLRVYLYRWHQYRYVYIQMCMLRVCT